jgi:FKBP12-rapamycin complex-associated protein
VCRVSDSAIRKAAALTCSSLLVRSNKHAPTRGYLAVVIGEVLERLLNVGIADPDPSIRKTVLSCLDARFDHHLAQAENLRSLFIALNDEVFEIRELAILTIGRLTVRNPAYVMPSLRKTLIQLLTELGTLHSPPLLINAWRLIMCRVRLCVECRVQRRQP